MPKVVTQADVDAVVPGGTLMVDADATVTAMAAERAASRNVNLVRGSDGKSGGSGAGKAEVSRDLVRSVTRAVVSRVGHAGPQVVEAVVQEVLASLDGGASSPAASPSGFTPGSSSSSSSVTTPRGATFVARSAGASVPSLEVCMACVDQEKKRHRSRAVLTTTGRNTKGVVARVTARIADHGGDILDISQTLIGDFFTMIIVVDVASLNVSFERFADEIQTSVRDLGCQAMMMHEDVMTSLHRV